MYFSPVHVHLLILGCVIYKTKLRDERDHKHVRVLDERFLLSMGEGGIAIIAGVMFYMTGTRARPCCQV